MQYPKILFRAKRFAKTKRSFRNTMIVKLLEKEGIRVRYPNEISVTEQKMIFGKKNKNVIYYGCGVWEITVPSIKAGKQQLRKEWYTYLLEKIFKHVKIVYALDATDDAEKIDKDDVYRLKSGPRLGGLVQIAFKFKGNF